MQIFGSEFFLVRPLIPMSVAIACITIGCADSSESDAPREAPLKAEIGEFDPNAANEIVTPKPTVTDPITGPLEILKHVRVKLPSLQIEQALGLFNASEGRYPDTHEEFMTRIIKENNLALPPLSSDLEYQYDVANHKLVIVRTVDKAVVQ